MKKLILATAIILGGLSTMNAQTQTETTTQTEQAAPATNDFKEIKVGEVPAAVTESLKKAYPEAVINKAHMNGKNEYQLDVKVGDKEGALYADKTGKWIQK